MSYPTWTKRSSSRGVGGGDIGTIAGIVQDIMIADGFISMVTRPGLAGYPMTGGITTGTISGVDTPGILVLFPMGT